MKIFLAGTYGCDQWYPVRCKSRFILDTFASIRENRPTESSRFEDYILDSGAFTFLNSGAKADWNSYADRYADYVKANNIKNYVELDIDAVVGYKEVLRLRDRLESRTGRRCMPVWHFSRGPAEFTRMVREYSYACIGGIAMKSTVKLRNKFKPYMRHFIDEAARNKCRLHCLGFTGTRHLKDLPFYSVDSTTWLNAKKYGMRYRFDGSKIEQLPPEKGRRYSDGYALGRWCADQWLKFQDYAYEYL